RPRFLALSLRSAPSRPFPRLPYTTLFRSEPTIDYVVTKIPRFTFEKFPAADNRLTTQMKSVGEAMAIGRNFQESLHKAMRSMETGMDGFDPILTELDTDAAHEASRHELSNPRGQRLWYIGDAF